MQTERAEHGWALRYVNTSSKGGRTGFHFGRRATLIKSRDDISLPTEKYLC